MSNGFGVLINWTMSGYIIKQFGWHYAFYTVGIILGICAVVWYITVYDSPTVHPTITESEREFILSKFNKLNTTSSNAKVPPNLVVSIGIIVDCIKFIEALATIWINITVCTILGFGMLPLRKYVRHIFLHDSHTQVFK